METIIKVILPDGKEHRLVAGSEAEEPKATAEVPGRNGTGRRLLAVEVTVVPGGGDPAPVRRADATDIGATRSALEEDTFDAEDVLAQAEEANALDPVGRA